MVIITPQVFFGATLFVQVNLIVLTFICRDALFVSYFGREHRSQYSAIAVLLSSLVSTPAFSLASKLTVKLGRAATSLMLSGTFVLFYLLLESAGSTTAATTPITAATTITAATAATATSTSIDPRVLCGLFYVWSDVCVMLLQNQFWESCNSSFNIIESKDAFGKILLGNTIANLFVGFIFVPSLETYHVTTTTRILIIAGKELFFFFI